LKPTSQEPRTATVRDLRNRFAAVAKWIEDGERVTITRRGAAFATLSPARPERPRKVDWTARFKRRPPIPADRKLTKAETQAFYDQMRGEL
jgi:antitoxin (DNA-binding transcriptional repressor) of toxin-antitoxin stability system